MYVPDGKKLSPTDRSAEIKALASAFHIAVRRGDVFSPENYALDSPLRDLSIPTSTAPQTLLASIKTLKNELDGERHVPRSIIAQNLDSAVASISLAGHFLQSGQSSMPGSEAGHFINTIQTVLPEIRQSVSSLKAGL
jgi:hypothetical protein